ncbi:hypothetical protein CgunFtcFv8_026252 [Champsocephalus gunnari]|uniref:Uncharacterized protein n=1 Tax=Champsocephalus gunnari TaxID=52237 RepID=A0AAN8H3T0_CHAGU|nr:hypothetical protein CgunFtcFv8_026252 [Champsocephalus gunnari]
MVLTPFSTSEWHVSVQRFSILSLPSAGFDSTQQQEWIGSRILWSATRFHIQMARLNLRSRNKDTEEAHRRRPDAVWPCYQSEGDAGDGARVEMTADRYVTFPLS